MESLSMDLGELTEIVVMTLEDIPDQDWLQLRTMNPKLAKRYGEVLIRLNHRSFQILQLLKSIE